MTTTEVVWTIIVAAGRGRRYGADKLGETIDSSGGTVLDRSVAEARLASHGVVLVHAADRLSSVKAEADLRVVAGGPTRSESVRCGLAAVPVDVELVLVHDAARPLADQALYRRVIDALTAGADAVVPVIPVVDTIRRLDGPTLDRDPLRAVQTPQGFSAPMLRRAHAGAAEGTDDAALVEAIGGTIVLVDGDLRNLKITRPDDALIVRALLDHGRPSP